MGDYLKAGTQTARVPLAEMWNGSAWRTLYMPAPVQDQGTTGVGTSAISCASTTDCVAVGTYPRPSGYDAGFAEYWNGTKWTLEKVPAPAGAGRTDQYGLGGVSCLSDGECLAAGTYDSNPLMEYWNGSAWAVLDSSAVGGVAQPGIYSLSCLSTTDCTAVGYQTASVEEPLALGWNGTTWTDQNAPDPSAQYTYLHSVWCSSATSCMAVGATLQPSGYQNLAERWDGTQWTVTTTPDTSNASNGLDGVACPAAGTCEAVGSAGADTNLTVALGWNGSSWAVQPSPDATGSLGLLAGVACTSSCVAVGQYQDASALPGGLIETGSGTTWSQSVKKPVNGSLSSVSCSGSLCMAVGNRDSGKPFAQYRDGSTWRVQTITGLTLVSSVSCTSSSDCTAVGDDSSGLAAATWNGNAWTATPLPVPAGSNGALVYGVSCLPGFCLAVGYYYDSSSDQFPLAEIWNGTTWSAEAAASQGSDSVLNSVSCPSANSCEAVGEEYGSTQTTALAEGWNGTTWSIQATPSTGTSSAGFNGVSCPTSTACTAVGYDSTASPLIESWNGSAWTQQQVGATSGANYLESVSCTGPTTCTAAGSFDNSSGSSVTLIESEG